MRSFSGFCVTFAGTALVLMGFGAPAAQAQSPVVVNCTFELEWCEAMRVKFEQSTGQKALISRKTDGEILAQIKAEAGNPRFDVWHSAGPDVTAIAAREGLLETYQSPKLPELYDWAQKAAAASQYTLTPIYTGVIGFGYNKDLLAKKGMPEPKCWADLTNPAYRNEIQMADPSTSGTAYTMVATVLQIMGEDKGFEYLKALHKNINQYTRSGTAGIRSAARGETTIAVAFLHDAVAQSVDGFPIVSVAPCEGTGFEMPGVAIVKDARNLAGAKKWVDFVLSPEGQNVQLEMKKYQLQSNKDAKIHPLAPRADQVKLINYDILKYSASDAHDRILDRFEKDVKSAPK
ncbi:ABC transporter substrate-binding protein [Microvirga antarctica]|uniref:ABC transporter substrate-binding protein n=1 Tax=Microvirga antarctica TaxID=2819233 RepID=UPI001FEA7330|nr:ABC transporter substrate-binding protein [Microvirga antarctica]